MSYHPKKPRKLVLQCCSQGRSLKNLDVMAFLNLSSVTSLYLEREGKYLSELKEPKRLAE